ncbi:MAG: helix-turn-helix transcriptional regulator [Bacillota bacterium]
MARMRENASLTQTQLSRAANISQGYYSDIEGGTRCPSPGVAGRIARVLGIGEQDVYGVFYAHDGGKPSAPKGETV